MYPSAEYSNKLSAEAQSEERLREPILGCPQVLTARVQRFSILALPGKEDVTTMGQLNKKNIDIDTRRCTGCLICQLVCSFTYTGRFNPARARIAVEQERKEIYFTDGCVENCHLCVRYCVYGALMRKDAGLGESVAPA